MIMNPATLPTTAPAIEPPEIELCEDKVEDVGVNERNLVEVVVGVEADDVEVAVAMSATRWSALVWIKQRHIRDHVSDIDMHTFASGDFA
jgi:hypothetical protein